VARVSVHHPRGWRAGPQPRRRLRDDRADGRLGGASPAGV